MTQLFAEVAVNSTMPHRQTFSYSVPARLDMRPGHGVYVPFGRRVLQGVVLEVHDTPVFSEPEKIRPIIDVTSAEPVVDGARLALARWVAHRYIAPAFDAVALVLPPGFERRPVTTVRPLTDADEIDGLELTSRQRETLRALVDGGATDADKLLARLGFNALASLEQRGLVARDHALAPPAIDAKSVEIFAPARPAGDARAAIERAAPPKHSRRADVLERLLERRSISRDEAARVAGSQANLGRLERAGAVRPDREGHNIELALSHAEAIDEIRSLRQTARQRTALAVLDALDRHDELPGARLRADAGADAATLRWLVEIGVLRAREEQVRADPLRDMHVVPRKAPPLLPAQQRAVEAIIGAMPFAATARAQAPVFLLHGVTGSGKTEVYLAALDECVARGRRAIVLVPEIALTPQTVRRFRERFERVAVLHSGLTERESYDSWHGIAAGRYDVVVGARSAIFAPQPDIGLIVIDEEHEWTYKQHDPPPRYSARDVALELGRLAGAVVVLGSATPDVVSYHHAQRGEYTMLALPERIRSTGGAAATTPAMPPVTVVDMREELRAGNRSMFSAALRRELEQALEAGEQAILFLNRRGLAGHVQCRDCGFVPACSSCFIALTYHRQYDRLVCHSCGRRTRMPAACRECGSPRVRLVGAGVEKVEAEAAREFPRARLLRWDRDVTRGRHAHDEILARFLAHEADVLIGTQMIAKGLDMPGVTVVGVMNADIGLHLPEFRAGERTFQLITQVAGRAGRREKLGRVVVQTYQPEHYAIDAAARYDYEGFAATELESRRRAGYPPYGRLVRMQFAHTNPRFAREEAMRVQRALCLRRAEIGSTVEVAGPSPAYLPRARGKWRWQLLLRGEDPASLVRDFLLPAGWAIDVDPMSLT